jgi:negative regulator of flagellin synthesis FlgM
MKIGNPADQPSGAAKATGVRGAGETAGQARGAARVGGDSASAADSSATVQLSSAASALLAGAEGGFDAAKVQRVRDAIADGTYKINPEAIADKLIANAKELLGKGGNA